MRLRPFLKDKKGVAGLNVLLTIITLLFLIGIIIMVFALMGAELEEEAWLQGTQTTVTLREKGNTTKTVVNSSAFADLYTLITPDWHSCAATVTNCTNSSNTTLVEGLINSSNYTVSGCAIQITNSADLNPGFNNTQWNCSGTITYYPNTTASEVIFDTYVELNETTDWYGIIIVIAAMVVLILLTVIIISAIRGSGLIAGVGVGAAARETA